MLYTDTLFACQPRLTENLILNLNNIKADWLGKMKSISNRILLCGNSMRCKTQNKNKFMDFTGKFGFGEIDDGK